MFKGEARGSRGDVPGGVATEITARIAGGRCAAGEDGSGRWGQLASETRQRASARCGREEALTRGAGLPARKGARVARLERAGASSWAERGRGRREERAGPPGWDWAEGDWAAVLGWGKKRKGPAGKEGLGWAKPFHGLDWVLSLLLFFSFSISNSNQTKLI